MSADRSWDADETMILLALAAERWIAAFGFSGIVHGPMLLIPRLVPSATSP